MILSATNANAMEHINLITTIVFGFGAVSAIAASLAEPYMKTEYIIRGIIFLAVAIGAQILK